MLCMLKHVEGVESWNNFQRIQWTITKSKSGMVTKFITHLLTDTLPVLIIKRAFSLIPLGRYLLPVTTWNRNQSTGSSGKFFFTTKSRNVTIVRCRMSLVTIVVMDFVMIHWIQRKSFRKNSNTCLYSVSNFQFRHCFCCIILQIY